MVQIVGGGSLSDGSDGGGGGGGERMFLCRLNKNYP